MEKVRDMVLGDVDDVLEIEKKCFSIPWTREAFAMEIKKNKLSRYIVVQEDHQVVAYGGMWMILDEAHITNIAVHPEYRGKGYGKRIVKALIDRAREEGIFKITLEVRKSNEAALNLYKKYGFKACGIRPRYYQDNGEDGVIMWKE